MKNKFHLLIVLLILVANLGIYTIPAQASSLDAPSVNDVLNAVNALRGNNNQAALRINSHLMAAAQAQSDYQASIGNWSHTGPDGSSPTQRDKAAGYGGGAIIFTSENVAEISTGATIDVLLYSIWGDPIHWATMTSSNATDMGVGMTEKDGYVYYTLDVSYIDGHPASKNTITPHPEIQTSTAVAQPTATTQPGATAAASTSTTQPGITGAGSTSTPSQTTTSQTAAWVGDGAIVHVVNPGDFLLTIAQKYGVTVADIRTLNGIAANNDIIYPGQKLLIRAAFTPTASPSPTDTEPPPTSTLAPSSTQAPPATLTLAPTVTLAALPQLPTPISNESNQGQSTIIILVVVFGLGLIGLIVAYFLRKNQS